MIYLFCSPLVQILHVWRGLTILHGMVWHGMASWVLAILLHDFIEKEWIALVVGFFLLQMLHQSVRAYDTYTRCSKENHSYIIYNISCQVYTLMDDIIFGQHLLSMIPPTHQASCKSLKPDTPRPLMPLVSYSSSIPSRVL